MSMEHTGGWMLPAALVGLLGAPLGSEGLEGELAPFPLLGSVELGVGFVLRPFPALLPPLFPSFFPPLLPSFGLGEGPPPVLQIEQNKKSAKNLK